MKKLYLNGVMFITISVLTVASVALAQEDPTKHDEEQVTKSFNKPSYSPYAGRNFPTQVFF